MKYSTDEETSTRVICKRKFRVLVVDESAVTRQALSTLINTHQQLEVVGTAADPYIARDKIKQLDPDVLTLDVELPRMNGHQFLKNLMRLHPMPVVMVSSLTDDGAAATLLALELGAVDFMRKPSFDGNQDLQAFGIKVCEKLISAANIDPDSMRTASRMKPHKKPTIANKNFPLSKQLLAFGASTGGTKALDIVISELPFDAPGTVIVQHIPGTFSAAFAKKLDQHSSMKVKEAQDGEKILQGHAYLAPGCSHLEVVQDGAFYRCRISSRDPVNLHRPSVDVLFESVARCAAKKTIGVILTGMGQDGAKGLQSIHATGSPTIAQDEDSSIVWGMPGSAIALGAADYVLPLKDIAGKLQELYAYRTAA